MADENALRLLAKVLAPYLKAELTGDGDPSIDQHDSPLGKRRHLELVRARVLEGVKDGRRVLVRKSAIDAYLEGRRVAPRKAATPPANDGAPEDFGYGVVATGGPRR